MRKSTKGKFMSSLRLTQRGRKDFLFAILLLLPTLYILLKTFVFPIAQSLVWSFFKYNLMDGSDVEFVGMRNFTQIFQLRDFWVSMWNTTYFTVFTVAMELILGFFSALLLNQMFRGQIFFRGMIIIPWALLTLVNGLMWNWIYQPGYGPLTVLLHNLHLLSPDSNPIWLTSPARIIAFASIADIWKTTPYMTLILLAGLQSLSPTLYEAAVIDGSGFWKKVWHITIPQLMPSIVVAVVLRIIAAFRVYDILTVFSSDPKTSVSYLTFNYAFRYFYLGRASAMAWISTLFILFFIVIYIRMLKKNGEIE
ncbi:sugar ABC transporter permease [Paenibacillus frigoriresistens]|uniref:carbohydrate ABC transporter permease n=1 Tax=Paenibacillus alginolyticus TaxID=59839 RepID=UPI001562F510|nr:sugar ABC transporter permease [Paenibacillus frigoriresistens]NRF94507.1 sugar ABC transporter permease [Paenibacillus frigoriresistens]